MFCVGVLLMYVVNAFVYHDLLVVCFCFIIRLFACSDGLVVCFVFVLCFSC